MKFVIHIWHTMDVLHNATCDLDNCALIICKEFPKSKNFGTCMSLFLKAEGKPHGIFDLWGPGGREPVVLFLTQGAELQGS